MIKIEVENGKANIYTPYNPDFVKRIKGVGGSKWDSEKKCWRVPENAIEAVREIMDDVYGYSDIVKNDTVKLRIVFNKEISEYRSDVVLFGKVFSHATGRDSGARVGDDVAYVSGGAESGGSVKNWYSIVKEGSVAIVSNVNRKIYDKAEIGGYDITVGIMEDKACRSSLLLEEKERLLKRVAEIDKLLQEYN